MDVRYKFHRQRVNTLDWIVIAVLLTCLADTCDASVCTGYCVYQGTCTEVDSAPECACHIGFTGATCSDSNLVALNAELATMKLSGLTLTVEEAFNFTENSYAILQNQLDLLYTDIAGSVEEATQVIDRIIEDMATRLDQNSDISLINVTNMVADLSTLVHFSINKTACTVYEPVNCTIPRQRSNELLDRTDENMVSMVTLLLNTNEMDSLENPALVNDNVLRRVSISAIKSDGNDLPPAYEAEYGNLTLPFWETFQDTARNKKVIMNVMTYKESPYVSVYNPANVDSSIVRTLAKDKRARNINLTDPNDPITVDIDVAKVIQDKASLLPMEIHTSEGVQMSKCIVSMNYTVQAVMTEILIDSSSGSPGECTLRGKYGTSGYPTETDFDFVIKTEGPSTVTDFKPSELLFSYSVYSLILTIVNENFEEDLPIQPVILLLQCTGDVLAGKAESDHMCRTGELKVSFLDPLTYNWTKSNQVQIKKQGSRSLAFKSEFFGTFAASSFFLPPTPLDFDAIFLNFLDRLRDAPQVLATNCVVIVFFIFLVIPLRRADKGDRLLWAYLPLIDNSPDDSFTYYVSVYTALRSSKKMTATAFCKLIGENAASEIHVLLDGERTNFIRGTCSNFKLTTKSDLGPLKRLKLWHDNKGDSARWLLNKVVITEEGTGQKYVFMCGKWLSLDCEDGQNWRTLYPITAETLKGDTLFTENSKKRFFDDNLWFSISKRPFHSRYTRVQRLWSLLALLFLSMLTSAMWFTSEKEETIDLENPYKVSVKLGPFTFHAKQIYVGLMSACIAVIPSIIIVSIFRNRKFKGEGTVKEKGDLEYGVKTTTSEKRSKSQYFLPWWTIFISYAIVIICIATCGFFTLLYSLEFGKEKTNDWLLSFFIGTVQSIILLEPVKVAVLAIVFACCLKKAAGEELKDSANPEIFDTGAPEQNHDNNQPQPESKVVYNGTVIEYYPCPDSKEARCELRQLKRRLQLDSQLAVHFRDCLWKILYLAIVAMICSHNIVTVSYRQNSQLKTSIKDTYLINTTSDIYSWLTDYYIPGVFTKWYNDGELLRTAYEQRFMYNGYNYRLGLTQLRQVRTQGNCDIPSPMPQVMSICKYGYASKYESRHDYCKAWASFNATCFDRNNYIDTAFLYKDDKVTKNLPYIGIHSTYDGGGYLYAIGPKQSLALKEVDNLRNNVWIDINTRAVFVDSVSFNANTRLFSHIRVVFELTQYGMYTMTVNSWSSNLYPYVHSWDYFVLFLQVIFLAIVFVRIILFFVNIYKMRMICFKTVSMWIRAIELIFSVAAIAFYIVRIQQTIEAIENIRNEPGQYVSFDLVELFDTLYQVFLAATLFIISLDLLKPLKLNYHLFVLHMSLVKSRLVLFSFSIMLFILMFAFASYLVITVGPTVEVFKNLPSSLLTLFRFLLLMVALGNYPQMDSAQAQIAVGLFALFVSLSAVNIFITILTIYFAEVSEIQNGNSTGEFVFNQELNSHMWWRLEEAIRTLFSCLEVRRTTEKSEEKEIKIPDEKLNQLDQFVRTTAIEDVEFHQLVFNAALWCDKKRREERVLLQCIVSQSKLQTFYRFYDPSSGSLRLSMIFPDLCRAGKVDTQCYEIRNIMIADDYILQYTKKLKSSVFEFTAHGQAVARGQYKMQIHDIQQYDNRRVQLLCFFENSWSEVPMVNSADDTFECGLDKVPKFLIALDGGEKTKEKEVGPTDGIETHYMSSDGGTIIMNCDNSIILTFEPMSVKEKCELIIQKQTVGTTPLLHFTASTDVTKPVKIELPDTVEPKSQSSEHEDELVIAIKEGDAQWSIVNSVLGRQNAVFAFKVRNIKANSTVIVFIKVSEMGWVRFPLDQADAKTMKAINYISRYEMIALKWEAIAAILCVEIPPRFKRTSVVNTQDGGGGNECIKENERLPLTCQEKCFYVLHSTYSNEENFNIDSLKDLMLEIGFPLVSESLKKLF